MADKEIGELTTAGALAGTETVHIVQSGNSRKVALDEIATLRVPDGGTTGQVLVKSSATDGATTWSTRATLGLVVAIASGNFMN